MVRKQYKSSKNGSKFAFPSAFHKSTYKTSTGRLDVSKNASTKVHAMQILGFDTIHFYVASICCTST
jgi:hypothetical protein